jgi:hypothetical protein
MIHHKNYRPTGRWTEGLLQWIDWIPAKCRCTLVQVGVSRGDATLLFAPSFRFVCDVDIWKSQSLYVEYLRCTEHLENVSHFRMDSLTAAKKFEDSGVGTVYIDASHEYQDVKQDIAAWLPKVYDHGYIGGHDYNLDGVRRAVDEAFGKPDATFADDSWIVFKERLYERL